MISGTQPSYKVSATGQSLRMEVKITGISPILDGNYSHIHELTWTREDTGEAIYVDTWNVSSNTTITVSPIIGTGMFKTGTYNIKIKERIQMANGSMASGDSLYFTLVVGTPCVPAWKCETPLNGYEADGCGNRRTNPACNSLAEKKYSCQDNSCKESPTGTTIDECQKTCGQDKDEEDNTVIILIVVIIAAYIILQR